MKKKFDMQTNWNFDEHDLVGKIASKRKVKYWIQINASNMFPQKNCVSVQYLFPKSHETTWNTCFINSHVYIFCFRLRNVSTTSHCLGKPPRVYPVTHQVLNDHNAKYFTQFPELTKEDLEGKLVKFSGETCKVLIDALVDLDIW